MAQVVPVKLADSPDLVAELATDETIVPDNLGTGGATANKFLRGDGVWIEIGDSGGTGDMVGPSSSTDNALPRFDGAQGKNLQASDVIVDDSNNVTGVGSLSMSGALDVTAAATVVSLTVAGAVTVGTTVDGRDVSEDGEALDDHIAAAAPHSEHATLVGGFVPTSELGSGSADATKYLRGDQSWQQPGGGGLGDVVGPATATDERIARWDGTSGDLLQSSPVTISDAGAVSGVTSLSCSSVVVSGNVDGRDVSADGAVLDAHVGAGGGAHANAVASGAAGFLSGTDKAKLDGIAASAAALTASAPQTVGTANAVGNGTDAARANHVHDHGSQTTGTHHAAATTSVAGFMSTTDKQKHGDLAGGSVLARRFAPIAVQHDRPRAYRTKGLWIAGATGSAPTLHGAGTDHRWPFMLATCLDFEGYPHDLHQRLESSLSSGNNSGIKGYAQGDFIAKGEFWRGRKIRYDGDGYMQNGVNADAFFEFDLIPNPTASTSNYEDANRMRMLSGELGMTWAGNRGFEYEIELTSLGATAYAWRGIFRIYEGYDVDGGPRGQVIFEQKVRGSTTSGVNWLSTDVVLQLCWRVARIADLNTYPGGNQGSTLQLAIENYGYTPVGFN